MLFNSLAYAFFLPIVFIVYWLMPHKFRWFVLLISSYYFYMSWNPKYIVLIFGTTMISYVSGILIEKSTGKRRKKAILAGAAVICLGVLFIFKYFNFAIESFCSLFRVCGLKLNPITLKLILPVGISFYTFQTLSYVIDVYRGDVKAEKHFGYYAAFISFFPQLVAGPIERTANLLPQIKKARLFDEHKAVSGLRLMAWGYFKKIALADTLAVYVDAVYNSLYDFEGFILIVIILFFSIQIYCDFSGYSDIAVGTARLFGIDLMKNFNCPYFATSINEFWMRWHISLSTWFRDYVYIPLGGNRCTKGRQSANLMLTFLASGLWHGANWTYLIWGGVYGVAQIIENLFSQWLRAVKKSKAGKFILWAFVFAFCNMAWVFFRAPNLQEAHYILTHFTVGMVSPASFLRDGFEAMGIVEIRTFRMIVALAVLLIGDLGVYCGCLTSKWERLPCAVRWIGYLVFIWLIWMLIPLESSGLFIYFQF